MGGEDLGVRYPNRWTATSLAVVFAALAAAPTGMGYEVDPALHGVTISGRVTLIGPIPKEKRLLVHRDGTVCGATVPDLSLNVDSKTRGIAGVVVSVEGITRGKPSSADGPVVLENLTCQFFERANAALVGSEVHIKNSDPVMHNTHIRKTSRFGETVINVAQPVGAPVIEKALQDAGLLDVRCDAHPFMRASLYVFDHPYFTVTDGTGHFALTQVPAGTYRLKFWHELLGTEEEDITVTSSGDVSVDLELEAPR